MLTEIRMAKSKNYQKGYKRISVKYHAVGDDKARRHQLGDMAPM